MIPHHTMSRVYEDGQFWMHVHSLDGLDWQEPIDGWTFYSGGMSIRYSYWRHRDGREYRAELEPILNR